jgi:hypothetical protein
MKKVLFLIAVFCLIAFDASAKIKTTYRNALILAYSQANSVYEDDNIKLEIYDEQLWATNKTSKTIFIDLAQCFAFHNGASMPLFNREDKKQGDKKASKAGLSTKDDAYITLAPTMGTKQNPTKICYMTTRIYGNYSTTESPSDDFSEYDKRFYNAIAKLLNESKVKPKDKHYEGTVSLHFTEDESINNIGASIAYAFNKNTEEWNSVSLSTWVSDVIFSPYYIEMPRDLKKKEKKGFGIKETDPAEIHVRANSPFEFDEDKSPIIVCEWEGNYKKGTFALKQTWVFKSKISAAKIFGAIFTAGLTLIPDLELYKSIIKFDGSDADWGTLTYAEGTNKPKQSR